MFLRADNWRMFMKNKKIKTLSLPRHLPKIVMHIKKFLKLTISNISICRRGETSLSTSASVTVEASFVLSFFILLCASFLSLFFILQREVNLVCELNDSTQQMAVYANLADDYDGDVFLARALTEHISYLPEWTGNFYILEESYRKPWTGRVIKEDENEEGEDEYVYVSENGTVYHTTESCSHLSLTVSMVSFDELDSLRNESGSKYRPCERCGGEGEIVFIAKEGDCHHSDRNCSGLKRTYKKVKLTEVNLPPCKRCGG